MVAWLYLLHMAGAMSEMEMHAAMGMAMRAVMMLAMMLPSAAPMILTFTTIHRRRLAPRDALTRTGIFLLGYVIVWGAYSAVAALAQWGLHSAALLSPAMVSTSPYLG